jgi:hypothetical protein
LDIRGPIGNDVPEEVYPGHDSLVSQIRVSRFSGVLRVILDLDQDTPPAYSVHMMADWIMVRFGEASGSSLAPPAAVESDERVLTQAKAHPQRRADGVRREESKN